MSRRAWVVFVLVQLFGDLGPWEGLRMKSALGPALWFAGIIIMMPGRAVSLDPERGWDPERGQEAVKKLPFGIS